MLNEFVGWLLMHPPLVGIFTFVWFLFFIFIGGAIGHKSYDYLLKYFAK